MTDELPPGVEDLIPPGKELERAILTRRLPPWMMPLTEEL